MEMLCVKCNKTVEVKVGDEYPTLTNLVIEGFKCGDCRDMKEYTCNNCGKKLSLKSDSVGAVGMGVYCVPCTLELSELEEAVWRELIECHGMMSEEERMTLKRTVWNTWERR